MNFGIEIRNVDTGLAVTLDNAQAVADFLAAHPGETWEGYKCLGELPAPTPAVDPILPPLSEALSALVLGQPETVQVAVVGEKVYSDQLAGALPMSAIPEGTELRQIGGDDALIVGDTFADQAVSVVDAGKGDTYLPVDQGAQS